MAALSKEVCHIERLNLKKIEFFTLTSKLKFGFDGTSMLFTREIWYIANISIVSLSSEQTEV